MPIHYFTENVENPILDEENTSKWIESVIKAENCYVGNINYIFCNDSYLLEINKEHLEHDFYTDIITFDLSDNKNEISGDIYMSHDRALENAKTLDIEINTEIQRLLIHGILHLIGYNDKTKEDKQEIRNKEDQYLENY